MSRKQLLEEMDSNEISEWMAFHNIEPFGDEWKQTALIAMWVALDATQGKTKLKLEDFMPIVKRYDPDKDKQTLQKLGMILKAKQQEQKLAEERKRLGLKAT